MQRSESSMQSYQFTYKPFVLMAQIELSKLSCSTALILLCSSEHQSKLSQKQSGFSGSSFSTQCGHTWSYQGLDCPKLLYVICKYSLFWCFFFPCFLFQKGSMLNSMDFYIATGRTLLLLKCAIYPKDFLSLRCTESDNASPPTTLVYCSSFYYTETRLKTFFDSSNMYY